MIIGNKPKQEDALVNGKIYWWIAFGQDADPGYFRLDRSWHLFAFTIMKPYLSSWTKGASHPSFVSIKFAYWVPFFFY